MQAKTIWIVVCGILSINLIAGLIVWQVEARSKVEEPQEPQEPAGHFDKYGPFFEDFESRFSNNNLQLDPPNPTEPIGPSPTDIGEYELAGISCDAPGCSQMGREILEKGGTVGDAAIVVTLCMGVIQPIASGIGGGFLMTYYNATTRYSKVLIARESAPSEAYEDMFDGRPELSARGPLAVAVPGEMKGLWELYNHIGGNIPWKDLLMPIVNLCRNGFPVTRNVAGILNSADHHDPIVNEPSMAEVFVNPETGEVWQEGDIMTRPKLADTLEKIANSPIGGDELYQGELAQWLVEDLKNMSEPGFGGIITMDDMKKYKVDWVDPIKINIQGGLTMLGVPPPGSGVLVAFMLKLLDGYGQLPEKDTLLTYHRITEAMKHAFAKRTYLGDSINDVNITTVVNELVYNLTSNEEYINSTRHLILDHVTNNTYEYYGVELSDAPEDHGTAHMSIIGPNGDAIAITATVNLSFGARIRSTRTGIIYNDEMDDFSAPNITNYFGVPPSPNNFIRPGKRPLSSMVPTIFTDSEGKVRLAIGGAGGTRITTATTLISMRNLWYNETIKEAIDAPRFHHQLYHPINDSMKIDYEFGILDEIIQGLKGKEHSTERVNSNIAACNGVARNFDGKIQANHDFRKAGSIDGLSQSTPSIRVSWIILTFGLISTFFTTKC